MSTKCQLPCGSFERLAISVTVPPRSAVRLLAGSNPCAGFLTDRSLEAVEALRYCLLTFLFLAKRMIIKCLSVRRVEDESFSGRLAAADAAGSRFEPLIRTTRFQLDYVLPLAGFFFS